MFSPSARVGSGSERRNLYDQITAKVIAELQAGRVPWAQPWGTSAANAGVAVPTNVSTGRRYSGINVLILWGAVIENGFSNHCFLTFRQALGLGGAVRKGERGVTVVYADRYTPEDGKRDAAGTGEKPRTIPFLKRFTVFNVEQCDGLPAELTAGSSSIETDLVEPKVEALIRSTGIDFRIGGDRAFYAPAEDYVRVPPPQVYFEPINWHRTALHELGHATGHASRLKRDLSGAFGTKKYAFEELVAEMSAAFSCATLSVVPTVRHADYLGAWLEVLREDNRAIVRAASAASKAADYLLGFLPAEGVPAGMAANPATPSSQEFVSNASAPRGGAAPPAAF
jgi:antirestriction protein ArdC